MSFATSSTINCQMSTYNNNYQLKFRDSIFDSKFWGTFLDTLQVLDIHRGLVLDTLSVDVDQAMLNINVIGPSQPEI